MELEELKGFVDRMRGKCKEYGTDPIAPVAVGGLCDPLGLCRRLAGHATGWLEAVELTRPVTRPRDERVIAAEALDQGPGASHRPQEDATRPAEANRRGEGKKTEKKQEGLTPQEEEDAAKKTPPLPDFKPPESAEFQLGADTYSRKDANVRFAKVRK